MSKNRESDLINALAELAKAGIAFASEEAPDGNTVYVIDRIRLREDEVIALNKKGALTRQGIDQYLINRVA